MAAVVGDDPTENCIIHPFELSEQVCHNCGNWFCEGCLVTPWGSGKRALCIPCAVGHSGLRRASGNTPSRSRGEIRRIEKERKEARRAAARKVLVLPPKPPVPAPADERQSVAELKGAVVQHALGNPVPGRRSLLRRLRPA
jgi:hypothetical protein